MSEFDLIGAQRKIFTSSLRPLERLVALAICDFYSRRSPKPYPSVDELAYRTGLARRAVMRAIGGLETAGAVRVARGKGLSNRYELSGLMTLHERVRNQCLPVTGASEEPVPAEHPTSASGDTTTSASGDTRRNPLKEPNKEPISSAPFRLEGSASPASGSGRSKARKTKAKEPTTSAHKQVTDCYFAEFERTRGCKPIFAATEGTAVKNLLIKLEAHGGADEACRRVRNAFASFRGPSVTIRAIAKDPDAFSRLEPPKGGVGAQHGPHDADLVARLRAEGTANA